MTGRWSVRLAPRAKADLREILEWSRDHFGAQLTQRYAQIIDDALHALWHGPLVPGSRSRDDLGTGLRGLHIARKGRRGRHILIYRERGEELIEIARILQESMDPTRYSMGQDE